MTELPPSNLPYLFAAFAVVWVVFFIYAGYMSWRRQSVQRELEEMQESGHTDANSNVRDGNGHSPE
jgi:CcmD family protein